MNLILYFIASYRSNKIIKTPAVVINIAHFSASGLMVEISNEPAQENSVSKNY